MGYKDFSRKWYKCLQFFMGDLFPNMSLSLLINNWFCGDKSKQIVPFCSLTGKHLTKKSARIKLSQIRNMMNLVEIAARREGIWSNQMV
mmetsp:Transcript_8830/g.18845  ORF Transcript_8830/g.18845 Transcript_8830/m.18845 type:complete len:89 (+) Transcript_8830:1003-1269(+)